MGFIDEAARSTAFAETIERVGKKLEYGGYEDQRRAFDPKQAKEWREAQSNGRTSDAFRQCLEYHRFAWWPLERLQALALPGVALLTEGQWKSTRLKPALAFTPADLTTSFPSGPESLDRYLREYELAMQVRLGKVDKKDLAKARRRK